VKIVTVTQNPLTSQDEPTQMLRGEISRSNLHSSEWSFEQRSCNVTLIFTSASLCPSIRGFL